MKNIFIVLFFIGLIFYAYADDKKAITIKHIGEQDAIIPIIIINTYKEGLEFDRTVYPFFIDYYLVQESIFNDIIYLINSNNDLFGNRRWVYWLMPENKKWSRIFVPDEDGNIVIPIELLRKYDPQNRSVLPENDNANIPIPFKGILEFVPRLEKYGCFELFIERGEEEYYRYLVKRESSALFYSKLYNLLKKKEENNRLIETLESNFRYFYFIEYMPEIGKLD
jgi:hypothetical protein